MIYFLFLLLAGILQGLMISLNGQLGNYYDMLGVSFFVHGIAAVILLVYMKCKERKRIMFRGVPPYVYLVGFMGIALVVSSTWCILAIGATALTGLSVVGQMISSAIVDHKGWFGVEKQPFQWKEMPSYLLVLAGVWLILSN